MSWGIENPYIGKYTKMAFGNDEFGTIIGLDGGDLPKIPQTMQNNDVGLRIQNGINTNTIPGDGSNQGFKNLFSGEKLGNTLGGIGAILGGVGSVYDAYLKQKYQKKMFNMEKERIDRELEKQKKASGVISSVWG